MKATGVGAGGVGVGSGVCTGGGVVATGSSGSPGLQPASRARERAAAQEAAPTVLAILLRQSPALFFARGPPSLSPSSFQ